MFRWERGRQENAGKAYWKCKLLVSQRLRCDAYLLYYPTTVGLDEHVDPAPDGFEHHRVNIVFWNPRHGGTFLCPDAFVNTKRIKYFRPDIHRHSVTGADGRRLVLSFGWLRKSVKD